MANYTDVTINIPIQRQQGGAVLAVGAGGIVGFDAGALLDLGNMPASGFRTSVQEGLTAHAGGGQASGTPITATEARFTTVATAGDSGTLDHALAGMEITVINAGANSMNVFPAAGEQINALGANAAFAVPAGKTATFFCTLAGQWHTILSA